MSQLPEARNWIRKMGDSNVDCKQKLRVEGMPKSLSKMMQMKAPEVSAFDLDISVLNGPELKRNDGLCCILGFIPIKMKSLVKCGTNNLLE
jgi:hypothetical protein